MGRLLYLLTLVCLSILAVALSNLAGAAQKSPAQLNAPIGQTTSAPGIMPILFSCDLVAQISNSSSGGAASFKNPDIDGNIITYVSDDMHEVYVYDMGPDGRPLTLDDRGQINVSYIPNPGHIYPVPSISNDTIVYSEGVHSQIGVYSTIRLEAGQDSLFGTTDDNLIYVSLDTAQYIVEPPTIRNNEITWMSSLQQGVKNGYSCSTLLDGSNGGCLYSDTKTNIFSGKQFIATKAFSDYSFGNRWSIWSEWPILYGDIRTFLNGREWVLFGGQGNADIISDLSAQGYIAFTEMTRQGTYVMIGNVFTPNLKIPVSNLNTANIFTSKPRISKSFATDSKKFIVWEQGGKILLSNLGGSVKNYEVSYGLTNSTQPVVQEDLVVFNRNGQIVVASCR